MPDAVLFYGSSMGNTESVAEMIKAQLADWITAAHCIADCRGEQCEQADLIVLGTSTWEDGQLQDDWKKFLPQFDWINLRGKKIALFGLGDQVMFPSQFCNGLGTLYKILISKGAEIIGRWPLDGYRFNSSTAVVDGKFVGLILDLENQADLTQDRVAQWTEQIRNEMA